MKCSKCQIEMPISAPNWKKLIEDNFLPYKVNNLMIGNSENNSYWALCPDCYEELFSNLHKYRSVVTVKVEEIPNHFTKSSADYLPQSIISIQANNIDDKATTIYVNHKNETVVDNNFKNLTFGEMRTKSWNT